MVFICPPLLHRKPRELPLQLLLSRWIPMACCLRFGVLPIWCGR